jgi:phosphonate transport system permease protein
MVRTETGKIRTKPLGTRQNIISYTLLTLAALTIYGIATFNYKEINYATAIHQTMSNLFTMFTEPGSTHFTLEEACGQLAVTIGLTILTTVIGAVIALFFGLLAAENLSSKMVSNAIKGFVAFIRAVPTVLWVLIFAASAGLGSVTAVIGLSLHGIGYLIKSYSESFEELDEGIIEALKANGANWWQIVFQAVIPSSITYILAWTFMRFEINFTNAVAMGAAAGAGGIGYELFMAGNFYYNIREIGLITYMILAFAILLEICSNRLKAKIK